MKAYPLIIILMSVFTIGFAVNVMAQDSIAKNGTDWPISKLLWRDVENAQGKHLGQVSDFMVGSSGRIEFAILLLGGSEVRDRRYVAVPFEALSYGPSENRFILNTTSEKLAAAPSFDEYEHLANRKFADDIYRYFGLEPSWTEQREENWIRSDQDPFDLVGKADNFSNE